MWHRLQVLADHVGNPLGHPIFFVYSGYSVYPMGCILGAAFESGEDASISCGSSYLHVFVGVGM